MVSERADWIGDHRTYTLAWGLPTVALIGSLFLSHPLQTIVWTAALLWMGGACLINARRCGRRHCYLTGPFFLFMAILGLLHGTEVINLGPHGWLYLMALLIFIGGVLLWYLPERVWGKYRKN